MLEEEKITWKKNINFNKKIYEKFKAAKKDTSDFEQNNYSEKSGRTLS